MTALPAPGSLVAGKYRVQSLLGEGGMGAVFRAHHEIMDVPVAIKCLHPELLSRADAKERFVREARAAARIRHPNVVEVFDVGEHEGAMFMVMELLEGESFAELIRDQRLPIKRALTILIDAMEGVAAAHARGIVHRDIKPENIFVLPGVRPGGEPYDHVKILDFGVSKLLDNQGGTGSVTLHGQAVGTPEYMSPEQMLGERDVDPRADVYSFGVLLYRVLTGDTPFRGENFAAIAVQVATHKPPAVRELRPDIPAVLDRVVMRSMSRDREERHPNLRALIDALRPLVNGDALSMLVPLATHVAARGSSIARDVVSRSQRPAARAVWVPLVLGLVAAVWARWLRQDLGNAHPPEPAVVTAPPASVPALPREGAEPSKAKPAAVAPVQPSPAELPSHPAAAQAVRPEATPAASAAPSAPAVAEPLSPAAIAAQALEGAAPVPAAASHPSTPKASRAPATTSTRPRKSVPANSVQPEPVTPAAEPEPPTVQGLRSGALSRGDF
jgi:eukaryotic-like serine/threonine-protein kinase